MTLVREAMMPDPKALPASASAQEAAELLTRPEVRAVLVVDAERLVGVVTCEVLVERVVAAGCDPRTTSVGDVAEPVALSALPDMAVEDAYRLMEEQDVERLPVTDDGRLVGVLSRSALTRRLAEDEPPEDEPDASAS
ncbi:MAG TPA: CBS domain-containing protein [Gaiellaceae bacterium]|jgi:CBS domain-containing protein|nr:CBS domain-containing protein [Gaiellaceae bacterium]